jgi:hypothetical protein
LLLLLLLFWLIFHFSWLKFPPWTFFYCGSCFHHKSNREQFSSMISKVIAPPRLLLMTVIWKEKCSPPPLLFMLVTSNIPFWELRFAIDDGYTWWVTYIQICASVWHLPPPLRELWFCRINFKIISTAIHHLKQQNANNKKLPFPLSSLRGKVTK